MLLLLMLLLLREGGLGLSDDDDEGSGQLDEVTKEFWKFFRHKISEWNPCHIEDDGRVRYRWDEDVGAHDVEVDVGDLASSDSVCGV